MAGKQVNIIVQKGDSGPAVEDVQRKLNKLGYLKDSCVDAFYGDITAQAVKQFASDKNLDETDCVTDTV